MFMFTTPFYFTDDAPASRTDGADKTAKHPRRARVLR